MTAYTDGLQAGAALQESVSRIKSQRLDRKLAKKQEERDQAEEERRQQEFETSQRTAKATASMKETEAEEFNSELNKKSRQLETQLNATSNEINLGAKEAELRYIKDNPNAQYDEARLAYWQNAMESTAKAGDATNSVAADLIERYEAGLIDTEKFKQEYDPLYDDDNIGDFSEDQLREHLPLIKTAANASRDHWRAVQLKQMEIDSARETALIKAQAGSGQGKVKASSYKNVGDVESLAKQAIPYLQLIAPDVVNFEVKDGKPQYDDDAFLMANDIATRAQSKWQEAHNEYSISQDPNVQPPASQAEFLKQEMHNVVGRLDTDGNYYTNDPTPTRDLVSPEADITRMSKLDQKKREWVLARDRKSVV